jgi:hypothetical protein
MGKGDKNAMYDLNKKQMTQLTNLIGVVTGDLAKEQRMKVREWVWKLNGCETECCFLNHVP